MNTSVFVPKIPLRDFFRNSEKVNFALSPNGEYVAFMAPYENRMNIFVQKIGDQEAVRVTGETDRSLQSYTWATNTILLFLKDDKGDENFHLYSVDLITRHTKDLTPFKGVRASIVDPLRDNDKEILVSLNKRDPQVFDVYRLNIHTGDLQLEAENPGNVMAWVSDQEGKIRIATTTDGVNTSVLYRDNEQEAFRTIITTNFRDALNPIAFTYDNKHLYASSNIGRDKQAIVKYDIANGKELEEIFSHPDVDVEHLIRSRKQKKIQGVYYTTWKTEMHFFDDELAGVQKRLEEKLGSDYEIFIAGRDKNEEKYLVVTINDRSSGTYYLYDTISDKIHKLADVKPWLNEANLAEMKPITFQSRDGLTMHGYLTLPKGVKAEKLPVVVNPHGGPWYRDVWGFNPEVQFLANRGYAVLQINFRGSTGYGRKFWEASFKEWGLKMQDDITDGVKWLIGEGIADAKRVAIYGGSYGGYATLAGLAFTPNLYACGIDFVGVSNLFTFMNTIPPYWKPLLDMMHEMVGHPEEDKEQLTATSPVYHVDKIEVPLFVAQGAKDPRVNINESDQIVEALNKRGVDVLYMVKENEGHGFSNQENKFEFYEAMESFLDKHLKKNNVPESVS